MAYALSIDEEIARMLIKTGKADLNKVDNFGQFALYTALTMKKYDAAIDLLEQGADPNLESTVRRGEGVCV